MRNTVVSRWRWSAVALAISLSGCTSLSDCKYELGQKIRTSQAWNEFDGCNSECFTCDYQSGWKAGYYDVLTGGDGCPPVIAPKKYWKPPVFFEHDPSRRNDWYCGYQDGAACAKCQPDHHYLQTFLPGPVCCPVHAAAYHEVPSEPAEFPLEHLSTDPGIDAAPAAVPEAGTLPSAEGDGAKPAEPSSGQPPEAAKPSSKDYEKDPEPVVTPARTRPVPPVDSISLERLVRLNQATEVRRGSLVEKLVSNASLNKPQL